MRILILGATGAAGGSLLDVSLERAQVTHVSTLSRRPIVTGAPKHAGFLHDNLFDYSKVAGAFAELDACFFCVGRSATQVKDAAEYRVLTYDYAVQAARELRARSPAAGFHYLSGQGASLTSRYPWARVKAEAEQVLLGEFGAVCWRPGAIDGRRTAGWPFFYKIVIPAMRVLAPSRGVYVKGTDLARAMLRVAATPARGRIFENRVIRQLADEDRADQRAAAGSGT